MNQRVAGRIEWYDERMEVRVYGQGALTLASFSEEHQAANSQVSEL